MKKTAYRLASWCLTAMLFVACRPDIPMVNLGIDDTYVVARMKALVLHPEFPGSRYTWTSLDSAGNERVVQALVSLHLVIAQVWKV